MSNDTHNPQNLCVKQDKGNLKDLSNVKVSLFIGGIKQVIPKRNIELNGLVKLLQSSKQKELTAKIIAAKTDAEKQALKLQSYFFTPYGTFSYRENESIIDYNAHVVAFDWDKMEAEQVAKLIAILILNPSCFLCTKSPRQRGVKAAIIISEAIPLETHYLTLKTNANRLLKLLGAVEFSEYLDLAQFKLSQPFFLSYDEDLHYNPNAEPLQIKLLAVVEEPQSNNYQLDQLKRDFGFVDLDDLNEPLSLNNYILQEVQRIIDNFDPDGSRHPQIAKTKTVFGLLKQYPQNTVYDEVFDLFHDAMGELYSSPAEAKTQNAYKSLKDAQEAAKPKTSEAIEQILRGTPEHRNKYRVYVDEVLIPPQVALYMNNEILGTLGNFSLIIGKAKAKKSFLIAMLCAAALRTEQVKNDTIIHALPGGQNEVALFDTEMSKYHVQLAARRIHIMANSSNAAHVFNLRSLAPAERKQFIEDEILSNPRLGLVIIDGIKDLVTSINDEEQASMIASWLLKISEERNIHIIVVLHQNKSDNNARGHIGTELINKAETVLSVSVLEHDSTVSIVEPAQVRNREPQPFAFTIDEEGIPQIIEDYETAKPKAEKANNVYSLQESDLRTIITAVFSHNKQLRYGELQQRVKIAYNEYTGSPIGDNKAISIISLCKRHLFIEQRTERGAYTLLQNVDDLN
jgi:hypothetical protein